MSYKYLILNCLLIFLSLSNALPLTKEKNEVKYRAGIHNLKTSLAPVNIIGGSTSSIKKHPHQVAVLVNGTFIGSGIILNKNWVATLASMLVNIESESEIVLSAGNTDYKKGQSLQVQKIVIHPSFDFYTLNNDVALLKLSKSIKFTKKIKPISIASKHLPKGKQFFVSGWGVNKSIKESTIYKETLLNSIDQNSCSETYGTDIITNTMICAYRENAGPCWGDFGDVLTDSKRQQAYGLFSWAKGCAVENYPSVFTDLVFLRNWINSIIKKGIQENTSVNESEIDKQDNLKIKENNDDEKSTLFGLENLNDAVNEIKTLFFKNHHLLSKRSVDSFLDVLNDKKIINNEIQIAINEQEDEEAKQEDENILNENLNGEDEDVNEDEELEEEETNADEEEEQQEGEAEEEDEEDKEEVFDGKEKEEQNENEITDLPEDENDNEVEEYDN